MGEGQVAETEWVSTGAGSLLIKYPGQADEDVRTVFEKRSFSTGARISKLVTMGEAFDAFAISHDGHWIFASGSEIHPSTWLNGWDKWSPIYLPTPVTPINAAIFSRNNEQVIALGRLVSVWDLKSGQITAKVPARLKNVKSLSLSGKGRYLLASSSLQSEIVDLRQQVSVALIEGTASGDDWAFSPSDHFAVTIGPDAATRVYEVETGRLLWLMRLPAMPSSPARWSPDGKSILVQAGGTTLLFNAHLEDRSPTEIAALVEAHRQKP